jgi:asparagine synthase (glutamine-hydrolysing)
MSRIYGYVSAEGPERISNALHLMMQRVRQQPAEKRQTMASKYASFGWSGVETGCRPLNADGVIIAMDGYIYNSREFDEYGTEPDVVLFYELYKKYGFRNAVERINGDFAIALYDADTGLLWLARDRLGIKPLYYLQKNGCFAFSSRLTSFLGLPGVKHTENRKYVALFAGSHYRYFDNDQESTPFEEIKQLPAGRILKWDGTHIATERYWILQEMPEYTGTEKDLAEQYRSLLFDAVKIRYARAYKPAFTLSGGMDSSSILAASSRINGRKQMALSTTYEDKTYDESEDIRTILESYVERWYPIEIGIPDLRDVVPKMIAANDEPVATATWLSHFLLCGKAAEEGFGSLFGGLGGDELNAGEYEYFFYHFADLKTRGEEEKLLKEIGKWAEYHDHPIFRKNESVVNDYLSRCTDLSLPGMCRPERNRMNKYVHTVNRDYYPLEKFEPVMEHPFKSFLKNRTFQDITRETMPCCLRAEDRQAEAAGLSHFEPFLDYRLVEFMFRIPGALKIRDGVTKILLREAMTDVLPETTRCRIKKTGWNAPAHVWFSNGGQELLMDMIHTKRFQERGVYNTSAVMNIVREHQRIVENRETKENHMMFLWQLLNLEYWFQFIENSRG